MTRVEERLYAGARLLRIVNSEAPMGCEWAFDDGETARADVCLRLLAEGLLEGLGDGLFVDMDQQFRLKPFQGPLEALVAERYGAGFVVCDRRTRKLREAGRPLVLKSELAAMEREWKARAAA